MTDDIENYLTRYTDRDDPEPEVCHGCGSPDCECDDPPDDDCLGCGVCEWCIDRSIAAADDIEDLFTDVGEAGA